MNRRSIFKLLAGAACAAAMEIPGLAPSLPKAARYVVNPEWLSAAYEDMFVISKESNFTLRLSRKPLDSPGEDRKSVV